MVVTKARYILLGGLFIRERYCTLKSIDEVSEVIRKREFYVADELFSKVCNCLKEKHLWTIHT